MPRMDPQATLTGIVFTWNGPLILKLANCRKRELRIKGITFLGIHKNLYSLSWCKAFIMTRGPVRPCGLCLLEADVSARLRRVCCL